MRHTVEGDVATDHVGISAHAFLPKILGHHCHVGSVFFLGQKIATTEQAHAEHVEIVRRHFAAEKLNRIAQSGQSKGKIVFTGKTVENHLTIAVMLVARHR